MKKYIQIWYVLITFLFIYAFINKNEKSSYFDKVYKAEKYIISENYTDALLVYNELFNNYNTPRVCDYYNASLCAAFLNENEILFKYLKETVKGGGTMDFIKNPLILNSKVTINDWQQFELKYDSLYNFYKSKKNDPIITEFKSMLNRDQDYSYMLLMGEISQIVLDSLYLENMNRIVELIDKDSLPHLEYFNSDSKHLKGILPYVIIRHYFGILNRALYFPEDYKGEFYNSLIQNNQFVEEKLLTIIKQGKLSPFLISESLTYNNPNDLFGKLGENYGRYITNKNNEYILVEFVLTRRNYTKQEITQINKNRKKWNLPSFNHALEVTKYYNLLPDSIRKYYHTNNKNAYFNLTGELLANEYYLDNEDSLTFHQDCEKNLKGKFGFELEWFYLGEENGRVLPKDFFK